MHDDDLAADPRIPENRGSRRGQKPDATTEPHRIGSGMVSRHTRTGQAERWPIRPLASSSVLIAGLWSLLGAGPFGRTVQSAHQEFVRFLVTFHSKRKLGRFIA